MLLSSEHTADWTIQYVFMDSKNPTDPQEVNHAILYVNDGEYYHYVEATGSPSWEYFPEGVFGWWFDVVTYTNVLDFADQDLRWMDFTQRDFSGAILTGARMTGADLTFADLTEANLYGADLQDVDLYGAYLEGANLAYADLRNADLRRAYLGEADLTGADLRGADMFNAYLGGADLSGADLSGADLEDAIFTNADLSGADLSETNLFLATMDGADLSETNLLGADMSNAYLRNANLGAAYLYGADLFMTNLGGAYLGEAYLYDANLRGSYLWGANLGLANLYGANLYGADLGEADLRGANLDDADDLGRINWYGVIDGAASATGADTPDSMIFSAKISGDGILKMFENTLDCGVNPLTITSIRGASDVDDNLAIFGTLDLTVLDGNNDDTADVTYTFGTDWELSEDDDSPKTLPLTVSGHDVKISGTFPGSSLLIQLGYNSVPNAGCTIN